MGGNEAIFWGGVWGERAMKNKTELTGEFEGAVPPHPDSLP